MADSSSTGNKIIRATGLIMLAHVIFKASGLIQLMIMGRIFGSRIIEAVYVTAFEGCVFTLFLIGEEVIGPAFLPVFMGQKDKHGETAAWKFANIVLSAQFLILLAVSAIVMMFPEAVIRLLTAWDEGVQPEKFRLASDSLVWTMPALMCLSLGSTTYIILNGYKRFFLAAFGDAAWKIIMALTILVAAAFNASDYRILILGIVIGSVAKLATHLAGLVKEIKFVRFSLLLKDPVFRSLLILMLPLIGGILFAKVRDIFNNVWVLSHVQTDGLMQANLYGRKLHGAIGWLVPYALSIAMFPFLCEMVDKNDRKEFSQILSQSCRMLLSVFIPLSLVCVVLAKPLTFVLFKGGEFTSQMASWTALSMACYILVLPAAAVEFLLMQAFFAHRKMISVTVVGITFSTLSMVISGVGIVVYGLDGAAALAVIALGFVLSRALKTSTLVVMLRKHVEPSVFSDMPTFLLRTVVTAVVSAGLCYLSVRGIEQYVSSSEAVVVLAAKLVVGGAAATVGFLMSVWLLKLEEPRMMMSWMLERIKVRRGK
jgi:putative peptidoglycan lipid II flippase